MRRHLLVALAALSLAVTGEGTVVHAASAPAAWDELVKVKSKRLYAAYILPGADFRAYNKVMVDPTEIAFKKNWQRDYNASAIGLSGRITDKDLEEMQDEASKASGEIFAKALAAGGYQIVTAPGPDVLRFRTALVNIAVTAPDVMSAGRSRSFAREAGEATLVVEVRDSVTGAILGRALDRRAAGHTSAGIRNRVTNRADFRYLVEDWANASVKGLNELKSLSPVSGGG
jgi:hypothetical protein